MQLWTDLQRACPDALWAVVGGVVGCAIQQEGDVQPRQVPIVSPVGEKGGSMSGIVGPLPWLRRARVRTAGAAWMGCRDSRPSAMQVWPRPHRQ